MNKAFGFLFSVFLFSLVIAQPTSTTETHFIIEPESSGNSILHDVESNDENSLFIGLLVIILIVLIFYLLTRNGTKKKANQKERKVTKKKTSRKKK